MAEVEDRRKQNNAGKYSIKTIVANGIDVTTLQSSRCQVNLPLNLSMTHVRVVQSHCNLAFVLVSLGRGML
jgi:hypothetical protein